MILIEIEIAIHILRIINSLLRTSNCIFVYPKKNIILIIRVRNGWQNTIKSTNAMHRMQQKNFAQSTGPHSWLPSTNGFHDHFRRPTGGGRYGFVFGSFLAEKG